MGIDTALASSLLGWAIALGPIGAHLFDAFVYFPERIAADPFYVLRIWDGLSSFGGMIGGLLGVTLVMRRRQMSATEMLRFTDCLLYALPFTLAIGRLGCGLQHDHPGVSSTSMFAVAFPDGPRFDLGLLEFFYLVVVSAVFWLSGREPDGFYLGLFFLLYAPVRFMMDALRVAEARYFGWTPGQYLSLVSIALGLFVLWMSSTRSEPAADPEAS